MAIKLNFILFFCFLISSLSFAQEKEYRYLDNNFYELGYHEISPDGNQIAFRKNNNIHLDTVFFKSINDTIFSYRLGVKKFKFISNNAIVFENYDNTELYNFKHSQEIIFNDVKKIDFIECLNAVIILNKSKDLIIYNEDGKLKIKLENVLNYYLKDNGDVIVLRKNHKEEYEIISVNENEQSILLTETNKVLNVIVPKTQNHFIYVSSQFGENSKQYVFFDVKNNYKKIIDPMFRMDDSKLNIQVSTDESNYIFKSYSSSIKKDSIVDIWYTNEKNFSLKTFPNIQADYGVFNVETLELGFLNINYPIKIQDINNDKYFLVLGLDNVNNYEHHISRDNVGLWNVQTNEIKSLKVNNSFINLTSSNDGNFLLLNNKNEFIIISMDSFKEIKLTNQKFKKGFFTKDSKSIFFQGTGGVWKYDLLKNNLSEIDRIPNYESEIIFIDKNKTNEQTIVWFKYLNPINNHTIIKKYEGNLLSKPLLSTKNKLSHIKFSLDMENLYATEENFNLPPRLIKLDKKELINIFQPRAKDEKIKQEIFHYKNKEGKILKGILYYPYNFKIEDKYPLIVHIYGQQFKKQNEFVKYNSNDLQAGFNIRYYIENGYFVFLPDIIHDKRGTGISALDCVERGLKLLKKINYINFDKMGLIGHSHGGYETNFIAANSNHFKTYVSGAGNSDIIRSYFSYNYNFLSPFYWQYENGQYEMPSSFSENKKLYLRNSPIINVDKVKAPILLWAGKKDQNIEWDQVMQFYIGLKRNMKDAVALFYPNEGHGLLNEEARFDLFFRIFDWFNFFLKDKYEVDWITKQINN